MRASDLMLRDGVAYHIGARREHVTPNLFLVGDPARAEKVAARFDAVTARAAHREFVTLSGHCDGVPMTVMGTGIGTDNVEIALLEAFSLLAFDEATRTRRADAPAVTVIRVGTSAGIQADIEPGTLAISSHGLGFDSTGLYYDHEDPDPDVTTLEERTLAVVRAATPQGRRFRSALHPYAASASPVVTAALTDEAARRGLPHVVGATAAAPGFYGPSGRYIEGLRNTVPGIKEHLAKVAVGDLRVVNMEMESSLIFHLCGALGVRSGTLCPIISSPARQTAVADYRPLVEDAISVAIAAMIGLSRVG